MNYIQKFYKKEFDFAKDLITLVNSYYTIGILFTGFTYSLAIGESKQKHLKKIKGSY